jgi:hypothetical protein
VWEQLLRLCKTSESCLSAIINDLDANLQAARASESFMFMLWLLEFITVSLRQSWHAQR